MESQPIKQVWVPDFRCPCFSIALFILCDGKENSAIPREMAAPEANISPFVSDKKKQAMASIVVIIKKYFMFLII